MKFLKGCLAVIGGLLVVIVLVAVIVNLTNNFDEETIPTVAQTTTTVQPSTAAKTSTPTQSHTTTPPTTSPTATTQPPPEQVELSEAVTRELVELSASGRSTIDRIQIKIISKSSKSLQVTVLPGTMFVAGAGVQNMVVTTKKVILLDENTTKTIDIDAACANMELDVPEETDSFGLGTAPIPEDLKKLLALDDFSENSFRIRQFAIWTITDNPKRDDYVGIGSFGMGSGPSDEEMAAIKSLFEKAGISTSRYQALN